MIPKERIITLQKSFLNIWPPKQCFFLNGWILTFTGGLTGRSNSILAINYTGNNLDEDISIAETAYKRYNLPVRFKLADHFDPPELEGALLERGYTYSNYSLITMGCNNPVVKITQNQDFSYEFSENRSSEYTDFLAKYSSSLTEDQQIMTEVSQRIIIPKKCFILGKKGNTIVGSTMVILDPQGYLYIAELFVHPGFRRRKIGSSLVTKAIEWGMSLGCTCYWLHVERDNKEGIELYEKFGFQKWYNYNYLLKNN